MNTNEPGTCSLVLQLLQRLNIHGVSSSPIWDNTYKPLCAGLVWPFIRNLAPRTFNSRVSTPSVVGKAPFTVEVKLAHSVSYPSGS